MAFSNTLDLAALNKSYQDQLAKGGLVHPTVSQNGVNYDPTYDEDPNSTTFGQVKGYSGTNSSDYGQPNNNKVYDYANYDKSGGLSSVGKTTGGGKWSDIIVPLLAVASMVVGPEIMAGMGGGAGAAGGSGAFLGEGIASGIPAWDAAAGGAGLASGGASTLASIAPFTDSLSAGSLVQPVEVGAGTAGAGAGADLGLNGVGNVDNYAIQQGADGALGNGYTNTAATAAGAGGAGVTASTIANAAKVAAAAAGAAGGGGGGSGGGNGGGGNGTGTGGFDWNNLFGLISGLTSMNGQDKSSNAILDYLKSRQQMNDNMYAPGSPELQYMQQQMDRQDAAAGRNSQYGPRAVDLAGKIAQLKMDANTRMTTGISAQLAAAQNAKANSLNSVLPFLGAMAGNGGGSGAGGVNSLMNWLLKQAGGSGGTDIMDAVSKSPDTSRDYPTDTTTSVNPNLDGSGIDPNLGWSI